jgi:hypothetical protein
MSCSKEKTILLIKDYKNQEVKLKFEIYVNCQ